MTRVWRTAEKANEEVVKPKPSYDPILKSSCLIGGVQGTNYLIGMVDPELVAILLGLAGDGLVGLYQSATGLVGTLAGLGIGQSGVRKGVEAHGSGDPERVAQTIKMLRRACWVTGLRGGLFTVPFAHPLSVWSLRSGGRVCAFALLGVPLLLGALSDGQQALLQDVRRIGDLALLSILSAVVSTVVVVGLYAWLGSRVTVLKGVEIGDNKLVGAMSLVNRSLPANCVAAGIPARVIRRHE